jgi:outer membrane protein assembly factor BamB
MVILVATAALTGTFVAGVLSGTAHATGAHVSLRTNIVSGNDWTQYTFDPSGSSFTNETIITPANAGSLTHPSGWPVKGGGLISARPIVANNLVYWGTWDGLEHATPVPGASGTGWTTPLGVTVGPCLTAGVASSPAVANVTFPPQSSPTSVVYVSGGGTDTAGGGFAKVYALDALTGAVIWQTPLAAAPNAFSWSSPVFSNNHVYVGVSSLGDCPTVVGQIVELNAVTGSIEHTFTVPPKGCRGGGVWGTVTIDQQAGLLYAVTGNPNKCKQNPVFGEAIVQLRASDLSVVDSWSVPNTERVTDSDFGTVPVLFQGTVTPGGALRQLVGATNKNGIFYIWDRAAIHAGPVAKIRVANSSAQNISPASYDGTRLYVASKSTVVNGASARGAVRAFDPNKLSTPLWVTVMPGRVFAAVASSPGLVVVGAGSWTVVLNSATGKTLATLPVLQPKAATFDGAPTISHGVLYEGDTAGNLYAYIP